MYSNFLGMYAAGLWYNKSNNKVGFAYFSQETFLTICFAFLPLHGPPQLYLLKNKSISESVEFRIDAWFAVCWPTDAVWSELQQELGTG